MTKENIQAKHEEDQSRF